MPEGPFALVLRRLTERGLVTADLKTTEHGERALARARAEGKELASAQDEGPCTEPSR